MSDLNEQQLANDPSINTWLKNALVSTRDRDPVDVVNDVTLLLRICEQRLANLVHSNCARDVQS